MPRVKKAETKVPSVPITPPVIVEEYKMSKDDLEDCCNWMLLFINKGKKKQLTLEKVIDYIHNTTKDPLKKEKKARKPREGPSTKECLVFACEKLSTTVEDLKKELM